MALVNLEFPTYSEFSTALDKDYDGTIQKVTDWATSPSGLGKTLLGVGIGLVASRICTHLTENILDVWNLSASSLKHPFYGLSLTTKLTLAPLVCLIGPIAQELLFRWEVEGNCEKLFITGLISLGFSDEATAAICRLATIFFSSVLFGLAHFTPALIFWCNPALFVPQFIAATLMGIFLSAAKELSQGLYVPIGMNIGSKALSFGQQLI